RVDDALCAIADQLGIDATERMRDERHREVRHAGRGRRGGRERTEWLGAEENGRTAAPFELRGVVETPRRARPSVSGARQEEVRARGDGVMIRGRLRGAGPA